MEADMYFRIEYDNKVAERAVEILKKTIIAGDYDKQRPYRRKVSQEFCNELDHREERDGFKIEQDFFCSGVFNPEHICHIMKDVLTELAAALPMEPFTCIIETSEDIYDSKIEARYDGKQLEYNYRYEEAGWDMLYCEECDYMGKIMEHNNYGEYICPNCGAEITNYTIKPDTGHFVIKIQ